MSPEEAFAYMADFRNVADWDPGVSLSEIRDGDGPGLGTTYKVVANNMALIYKTLDFDAPNRMVIEAENDRLRSYDIIEVAEHPEGSAVTYDATVELRGLFAIFNPLFGLVFNRIGDKAAAGMVEALDGALIAK